MAQTADSLKLSTRAIYFLLCYAADLYDPRDELLSGEASNFMAVELPAYALATAAATILKRGVKRVYRQAVYSGPSVHGRLDMNATIAMDRGRGGSAVSVLTELSPDCPQNRLIKTALRVAGNCLDLSGPVRERSRLLANAFPGHSYPSLAEARHALGEARRERGESGYRRAMFWARLILRSTVPDGGLYRLEDPLDRRYLNRAFESFVHKALRQSLAGEAQVRRHRFHWNPRDNAHHSLVPVMETDTTVLGHDRCFVVDAKYYTRALVENRYGRLQFHSSHLYQIASYLRALRSRDPLRRPWSACLVYARSGEFFNYRVDLGDFGLQVLGLDLEQEPRIVLDTIASIWSVDQDRRSPAYMVRAALTSRKQS